MTEERKKRLFPEVESLTDESSDQDKKRHNKIKSLVQKAISNGNHQSASLKLMLRAMEDLGCPVKIDEHVVVRKCGMGNGMLDAPNNRVVICDDGTFGLVKLPFIMVTLAHELVHLYDHCRSRLAMSNEHHDPRHIMCSEIRAATMSGQCSLQFNHWMALFRGVKNTHRNCVKKYATRSFGALYSDWKIDQSHDLFDELFPSCSRDHEPFDRIPISQKSAKQSYKAYMTRHRYNTLD